MKRFTTLMFLVCTITVFNLQAQTNIALNKNVVASSETEINTAVYAVDGDGGTRWESATSDPQWIVIDLEESVNIGTVVLNWEGAYATEYEIQVTDDTTSSWTTIYTETEGNGGEDNLDVTGTGRFIRMYGTTRGTIYGYSLWEFEVYEALESASDATLSDLQIDGQTVDGFSKLTYSYDIELPVGTIKVPTITSTYTQSGASANKTEASSLPGSTEILVTAEDGTTTQTYTVNFTVNKGTNIAEGKTAVASSENYPALEAVDGNLATRWESAATDPQWIVIDLEETVNIGRVVLNWETAYAAAYEIQVTDDTTSSWTTIYTETSGDGGEDNLDISGTGRFIRMYGTTRGTIYGYSLWEFEVYAAGSHAIIDGDAGWRMLSIPVAGATVSDISDDSPVQGIAGGDYASEDANFYIYDTDAAWEEPTNVSTPWGDGYGFIQYFYNNTLAGSSTLPVTLGAEGTEPQTDVTVSVNSSNGYTLLGNPFTNNLALDDIAGNGDSGVNSGLISPIQVWDDGAGDPTSGAAGSTTGSYVTYNFGAEQGEVIAPWQGFMLQADDATSVTFETTDTTSAPFSVSVLSKKVIADREIKFELEGPKNNLDKAAGIYFIKGEDENLGAYDGKKLLPLLPNYATIALRKDDQLLAQESRNFELTSTQHFNLDFTNVGLQGEFTLSWPVWNNIPADWEIWLTDHKTNEVVNMQEVTKYVFTDVSNAKAKVEYPSVIKKTSMAFMQKTSDVSRFSITISKLTVSNEPVQTPQKFELNQNYPNPFNPTTTIGYSIYKAGNVNLSIYNSMGQKVVTLLNENKTPGTYKLSWDAANSASGVYFYRLESMGQVITRRMILIK